jgi:hypothetical protein
MKRFGSSVGRQARALPRAPFGLRGLTLAAASKRGPPCDRRLAVVSLAHRFGRVERFARFQNPEAEDQKLAHCSDDNLLAIEPAPGLQSRHQRGDRGIISHRRHGRHIKRSAKNGVADLGDTCHSIDGCS